MRGLALLAALLLAGCGGGNQALLASGGHQDFAEMSRVSDLYGAGQPDATVPGFRIWVSKSQPKIMVQTADLAGTAAAGFVRGLTAGLVKGEQEFEPYRGAAAAHLAAVYGPGCSLANSQKLTRVGWEWDYSCPSPQKGR